MAVINPAVRDLPTVGISLYSNPLPLGQSQITKYTMTKISPSNFFGVHMGSTFDFSNGNYRASFVQTATTAGNLTWSVSGGHYEDKQEIVLNSSNTTACVTVPGGVANLTLPYADVYSKGYKEGDYQVFLDTVYFTSADGSVTQNGDQYCIYPPFASTTLSLNFDYTVRANVAPKPTQPTSVTQTWKSTVNKVTVEAATRESLAQMSSDPNLPSNSAWSTKATYGVLFLAAALTVFTAQL